MQYRQLLDLSQSSGGDATADNCGTNETRSETMNNTGANMAEQADAGHRVLYVLASSLALAVIGMIAVALTA